MTIKYFYNNGIQIKIYDNKLIAEIIAIDVFKSMIDIETAVEEEINMDGFKFEDFSIVNIKQFNTKKALCINLIEVNKNYQKQGIGTTLLSLLTNNAKRLKYTEIYLNSSPIGEISYNDLITFYKNFGFEEICNDKLNAIMVKHLY